MKKMEEEEEGGFTKDKFINKHQLNIGQQRDFANIMAENKKLCKYPAATAPNHFGRFTPPPGVCEFQSLYILTNICYFLVSSLPQLS